MDAFFPEDKRSDGTSDENGQSDLRSNVPTPVPTGDSGKGKAANRVPSRGEVAKRNADAQSDRVYNRKEMNGKYQVGSGRIVAVTHDTPFIDNSISQKNPNSNSFSENSSGNVTKERRALRRGIIRGTR